MRSSLKQEIGLCHMKTIQGSGSLLQMAGLLARLCKKVVEPEKLTIWRQSLHHWLYQVSHFLPETNKKLLQIFSTLKNAGYLSLSFPACVQALLPVGSPAAFEVSLQLQLSKGIKLFFFLFLNSWSFSRARIEGWWSLFWVSLNELVIRSQPLLQWLHGSDYFQLTPFLMDLQSLSWNPVVAIDWAL